MSYPFFMMSAMGQGGGGEGGQDFLFNPSDKRDEVTLSNGNKTASVVSPSVSGHYYGMCTLPKNSGKWIFEFTIDSMPPTDGRVSVGMADAPATTGTVGSSTLGVETGFLWWVRKSSPLARFYNGPNTFDSLTPATQSFDTGDRVTFTVDFSTKEVKAYRNGTLIHTKTVSTINVASLVYAPVVKLWGTAVPATVSIPSDIMYPVEGFDPWV